MKINQRLMALTLALFLFSCSKEESLSGENGSGGGSNNDYQPTTAGSEWTMNSTTAGTYTLKSLGSDTLVSGQKYFKFDNSLSGREYVGKKDGVYTVLGEHPFDDDKNITMITLKDAPVGTTWTNVVDYMGATNDFKYKIVSRDADKTVNGKVFTNVITVEYDVTTQDPFSGGTVKFASGRHYYSKGVGVIASSYNMDFFGMQQEDSTYLVKYTIK